MLSASQGRLHSEAERAVRIVGVQKLVRYLAESLAEKLAEQYPATLFSDNPFFMPPQRGALTQADRVLINSLRNRHLGERCFVVGNGPSLTCQDLEQLRFEYTFASNKIYLLFKDTTWRPTFYSCEDTLVAQQAEKEIVSVESTLKIFPSHLLNIVERGENCYFVDFINHFELLRKKPSQERWFSDDLAYGVHWGSTVTYTLIQMAVFMGFKDIYLIGLDHRYVVPKRKVGGHYIYQGECNHFSDKYRAAGEKWHAPRLEVLEISYSYAREHCEKRGVSLLNASRSTDLKVLERVDFDAVLAERR